MASVLKSLQKQLRQKNPITEQLLNQFEEEEGSMEMAIEQAVFGINYKRPEQYAFEGLMGEEEDIEDFDDIDLSDLSKIKIDDDKSSIFPKRKHKRESSILDDDLDPDLDEDEDDVDISELLAEESFGLGDITDGEVVPESIFKSAFSSLYI